VQAVGQLVHQAKAVVLGDKTFIVPEPALKALDREHVSYTVLQWLNQDDVHQALRNPLAYST